MGNPLDKLSKADLPSQRPAGGIPDPRQALVPRLPRTGQRRQGARRENNMGFQGGIDKERSFWAIVQWILRFSNICCLNLWLDMDKVPVLFCFFNQPNITVLYFDKALVTSEKNYFCYIVERHETKNWKEANRTNGFPCHLRPFKKSKIVEKVIFNHKFFIPENSDTWLRDTYG